MRAWIFLLASIASLPAASALEPARVELSLAPRSAKAARLGFSFLGLSYEKSKLATAFFDEGNGPLLRLLGPMPGALLRIGANAVDKTRWNAAGPGLTAGEVAPSDVKRLASFARRTGWKVLYGLNFAANTPESLSSEAAFVARELGDSLAGFEIGNEPDLYSRNGLRPPSFGYADFRREWETDEAAVRVATPNAKFAGPATTTGIDKFCAPFARDEASRIALLTHHYYRGDGQSQGSTIDLLLGGDPRLDSFFASLGASAAALPGGFRIAEANSFYNGGAPGVSNAFAAALWTLDFLFQNAAGGSSGVNFHGGNGPGQNGGVPDEHAGGGYTPIADDGHGHVVGVRPVFYGMALFAKAARGGLRLARMQNAVPGLSAFAFEGDDGHLRVVLLHKGRAAPARVGLHVGRVINEARVLSLTAPSLESVDGLALGGAAIDVSGEWTGRFAPVPVLDGEVTIDVPPASAELIELQ